MMLPGHDLWMTPEVTAGLPPGRVPSIVSASFMQLCYVCPEGLHQVGAAHLLLLKEVPQNLSRYPSAAPRGPSCELSEDKDRSQPQGIASLCSQGCFPCAFPN